MSSSLFHRWMWFWCWSCYQAYMTLPMPRNLRSGYGRFSLWLLGYAGAYANSTWADFYLCRFFYRTDEEMAAAWGRFEAAHPPADRGGER